MPPEPSAVIQTDRRKLTGGLPSSDSGSESNSDSYSGSDSWLESPSEPDVSLGKSSALPLENNLSGSQKDQIDPKKAFPKELDTNLSLKENQIIKKKNISNTSLSNAKTEKEKQIKNDPKRTSK